MENLKATTTEFLLREGLMDLHKTSKQWVSEVDLWKLELDFFQKLLDSNAHKVTTYKGKKTIGHLQNLITYYQGELLDEFAKAVRKHEKYLNRVIVGEGASDESYRVKHDIIDDKINSFKEGFKSYKSELFKFISELM
ncbi:MAG: hypothetical protein DHS20C17_02670 [Cyclobacteriaceae bacterium]|nr:MAG: hypothetical protein DHS20C17_02670 [Cyclobacteriaceae bacterium]